MDALFEIVSGFTTTGASVLPAVEPLSKGILYWRSFSHWLGGMGVLVFLLAFTQGGGKGQGFTMHLLRAESPGPNVGKLVPKMRKTAAILYLLYICLTILNVISAVWAEWLCLRRCALPSAPQAPAASASKTTRLPAIRPTYRT